MSSENYIPYIYSPKIGSQNSLSNLAPYHDIYFYPLARLALKDFFLKQVKAGDTVLVPSFICKDILPSFSELNIKIEYFHLNEDLSPLFPETTKAKALIMVNYFGFDCYLRAYQEMAKKHQLILIEDNAHGFLSQDHEGRWLGTRTDIGLMSFRKTITLPHGAALLVRKDYRATPSFIELPKIHLPLSFKLKQVLAYFAGPKLIQNLAQIIRLIRHLRSQDITDGSIKNPVYTTQYDVQKLIETVDWKHERLKRQELYKWCHDLLKKFNVTPVFNQLNSNCAPYTYAFHAKLEQINEIQTHLQKHQLEIFSWPDLPAEIVDKAPSHYKNVYCVRFVW